MFLAKDSESPVQLLISKQGQIQIKNLGNFQSMKAFCNSNSTNYLLSYSNSIYTLENSILSRVIISIRLKITNIFASKKTLLILSEIGVYSIGYDVINFTYNYTAKPIEGLEQITLQNASICTMHASGIDDIGNLYI